MRALARGRGLPDLASPLALQNTDPLGFKHFSISLPVELVRQTLSPAGPRASLMAYILVKVNKNGFCREPPVPTPLCFLWNEG